MPSSTVNIHEAKTHFSKLIERVTLGEEIVIGKAGRPVARLVPIAAPQKDREPGSARGKISISKDFDEPLPDEIFSHFR